MAAFRLPSLQSGDKKKTDNAAAATMDVIRDNPGKSTNKAPGGKKKVGVAATLGTSKSTSNKANDPAMPPPSQKNRNDTVVTDEASSSPGPAKSSAVASAISAPVGDRKKNNNEKAKGSGGKKQQKKASSEPTAPSKGDGSSDKEKSAVSKIAKKGGKSKNSNKNQEISTKSPTARSSESEEDIEKDTEEQRSSPKKKNANLGEAKKGTKGTKATGDAHQASSPSKPGAATASPTKGTDGRKANVAASRKKTAATTNLLEKSDANPPTVHDDDRVAPVNFTKQKRSGKDKPPAARKNAPTGKAEKTKASGSDGEPSSTHSKKISKRNESAAGQDAKREQSDKPTEPNMDEGELATHTLPLVSLVSPKKDGGDGIKDMEVRTNGPVGTNSSILSPKKKRKILDPERLDIDVDNVGLTPSSPNKAENGVEENSAPSSAIQEDSGAAPKPSSPVRAPKARGLQTVRQRSQSPKKKVKKKLSESEGTEERVAKETDLVASVIASFDGPDPGLLVSEFSLCGTAEVADAVPIPSSPEGSAKEDDKATKLGMEAADLEMEGAHANDESPMIRTLKASLSPIKEPSKRGHTLDPSISILDNTKGSENLETSCVAKEPLEGLEGSHQAIIDNDKNLSGKTERKNALNAAKEVSGVRQNDNFCALASAMDKKVGEIPECAPDSLAQVQSAQREEGDDLTRNSWQAVLKSATQYAAPAVAIVRKKSETKVAEDRSMCVPSMKSNIDSIHNHPTEDICRNKINAAITILANKSNKEKVEEFIVRIQDAEGFPHIRPLSSNDTDIVRMLKNTISDDPAIIEINIDSDIRFQDISRSLVIGFAEGMRSNLHLKALTMTGLHLGDYFLGALATSLGSNFVLTKVDLSNNQFSNEGLTEFCQALGTNNSCQEINLSRQHSKIFESSYEDIFDALEMNRSLLDLKVDFHSNKGAIKLATILNRNRDQGQRAKDLDEKLMASLRYEAELAEYLCQLRKAEQEMVQISEVDWGYLYELSILHEKSKAQDDSHDSKEKVGRSVPVGSAGDESSRQGLRLSVEETTESMARMTPDGSFLTCDYISKYLKVRDDTLTFDFCGQWRLFKSFPTTDPARPTIVAKFVTAFLSHPQCENITDINMANSCLGSDFFAELASRCLGNEAVLPRVRSINAETNNLTEPGIVALAKCISDPFTLRNLQVVKLENQKSLLSSRAEFALARAMCVNRSVIVMSLRVRSLLEKQQIINYVVRNIDYLRQARRRKAIETGTLKGRKRSEMEAYFDKIKSNDPTIIDVELVGNHKFKGLNDDEKVKAAESFATDSQVKVVIMSNLGLDDRFAQALGKSLASNKTIEKIVLDSNSISGEGLKALFVGLAKNNSVFEIQLRHQSTKIGSLDEELLPDILEPNKRVIKLGIDLRSHVAKMKIDRIMSQNHEHQRKRRSRSSDRRRQSS